MVKTEEFPNEKVKNINLTVLSVHGDRDVTPIEQILKIYRMTPNSELAVAPNSCHSFPINNFRFYFNLILDFLQRSWRFKDWYRII